MLAIMLVGGTDIGWHVGEKLPLEVTDPDEVARVQMIQADEHELQHIATMFPQFVPNGKRVARFYGDVARTIYANL